MPDEKKFMIDEAWKQVKFVDAGTVEGERVVIVENGKVAVRKDGRPVVDTMEAMRVWDEWVVEDVEDDGVVAYYQLAVFADVSTSEANFAL